MLLWEDEALAKGILFGRSKLNKMISQQLRRRYLLPNEQRQQTLTQAICSDPNVVWVRSTVPFPFFINAFGRDFNKIYDCETIPSADSAARAPAPALVAAPVLALADEQNWLFNHWSHTMVPRIVITGSDDLQLRAITQLAFQLTLLFTAIVAVAASDVASAQGAQNAFNLEANRRRYAAVALTLHSQTLTMLPEIIKQYQDQAVAPHQWDDVVATHIVLALGDIGSGRPAQWLAHIHGARSLLLQPAIITNPTLMGRFLIEFFVNHEVASVSAWEPPRRRASSVNFSVSESLINDMGRHLNPGILAVFGTLARLLLLIHQTTRLARQYEAMVQRSNPSNNDYGWVSNERHAIEAQLVQLYQYPTTDMGAQALSQVFEAKRLAAIVYLFARVDVEYFNLRHDIPAEIAPPELPKVYADKFLQVKQVSCAVLDIVAQISELTPALIWPLFVIGVVLADSDDLRWGILYQLDRIKGSRHLAQVERVIHVLERVWNETDLDAGLGRWLEILVGKGPAPNLT